MERIYTSSTNGRPAGSELVFLLGELSAEERRTVEVAALARAKALQLESIFEYRAAEEMYQSALYHLERSGAALRLAWAVVARGLSLLYLKQGRISLSRWYARRAVSAALNYDTVTPETLRALAFYGALLLRLGDHRDAARYLKRAYRLRKRAGCSDLFFVADVADLLVDLYRLREWGSRASQYQRLSRKLRWAAFAQG